MTTVRDILHSALPTGTEIVAGGRSLGREVVWATGPKPSPPTFGHVKGNEIVLLGVSALSIDDERMTLEQAVRQLAGRQVAAIAFQGQISSQAKAAADETGVAFLQLPASTDLISLERETIHYINERRREAHSRDQESGRRMMELAIAGEPLPMIVRTLAELAGHPVALEGRDGRVLSYAAVTPELDRTLVESLLADGRDNNVAWLRMTAASSPAEPPSMVHQLSETWSQVVAPVIGRDGLLGNLSMLVGAGESTLDAEALTSRGAAACAVVMAREYATLIARREIEVNVLDEVLDGALRSEVTLLQQANRLQHDLHAPHVVLIVRFDPANQTGIVRSRDHLWPVLDEIMARRGPRMLWRVRNNIAEILWPVTDAEDARNNASVLYDDLLARLNGADAVVSVGAGRVGSGLAGIQQSHQEAKQALALGRRLGGAGGLTRFEDLGIYRLIFAAEHLPEMKSFHQEALGSLIEYDQLHGGDLLRTLKAFFDAKGGPKEAASLLDVHRNTVLYRLDRIRQITGLDLDDADVRLRLQFALSVHLALFADAARR
jgi:purine catabolism regulator